MEESKNEKKGFILHRNVYEQMNLSFRTNKQRAECLFALCDFVFYDKEYEGKNKLIKSIIESAMPAIKKQRGNYERNSGKYNNKDNNKEINNNNFNNTYDKDEEEEIDRLLERINK